MRERLYKNIAISFIIINIWSLCSFFDYYDAMRNKYDMSSMTLFFNFLASVTFAIGAGILAILLRFTIFRTKRKIMLKNNFLYLFIGLFNLNLLIIWIISIVMEFLPVKTESIYFMLGISIITAFILSDICRKENGNNLEVKETTKKTYC